MTDGDDERRTAIVDRMPAFGELIGLRVTLGTPELVEAELETKPALGNRNGVLHGGAIMAFADMLGGTATFLNMPEGWGTTTIESKTNFFRPVPLGEVARASCVPLHRGRRTMVWQTTIRTAAGKVAAIVTQTQMVLPPE